MNLFKQQKFSIRKFNVGIFSALIATIAFLGVNPNSADAAEQDAGNTNNQVVGNDVNQPQNENQNAPINNQGVVDNTAIANDNVNLNNAAVPVDAQINNENNNANANGTDGEAVNNQEGAVTNNELNQPIDNNVAPVNDATNEQNQPQEQPVVNKEETKEAEGQNQPLAPNEGLNKEEKPVATVENNQTPKKRNKRDVGADPNGNNIVPNNNQPVNAQDEALTVAKQNATDEINQKATDKNQLIGNDTESTQEEKQVALNDVAHQQFNANNNINQANTTNDVTTAKNNGIAAIEAINVQANTKPAARNAIVQKVADQILTINNNPNATNEEKQDAVNQVHNVEQQALKGINTANTENDINNIQNQNVTTIGNVVPTTNVKPDAIDEVNQAATTRNNEISANQDATAEEKAVAKEQVNGLITNTTNNINDAASNQDVTQAKELGINQIKAITPATTVKDTAKNEVAQAAQQQKNNNTNNFANATVEEVEAANNLVDNQVNQANINIGAADTTNEVNGEKDNAIQTIGNITPTVAKKAAARDAINQAFEQKKQEINNSNQSTTEEKTDALNLLTPKKTEVDNNIDQANRNAEVDNAVSNGINEFNQINPATDKKQQAKNTVQQTAEAKKNDINQDNNSTTEEHEAANAQVDEAVTTANNNIDNAAANADVDNAVNNAQTEINQVQQQAQVKPAAKAEITQKIQEQQGVIQNVQDSTTEEKAEATQALQNAQAPADQAIDASQTNADVENTKTEQLNSIANILPATKIKDDAKNELINVAKERKATLAQTPDITQEELDDANSMVNDALLQGTSNIRQAADRAAVDGAKANGETTINAVNAFVNAKQDARDAITQAANQRKATFPNVNAATTEEQQAATDKVDALVTDANNKIANVTHNAEVDQIKNETINAINQVEPQAVQKANALATIKEKQDQQTYLINNEVNATSEEKEAALQALNQAVTNANNEINAATTNAEVATALQNGETNITNAVPDTTTKGDAKAEVEQAANNQSNLIDQNQDATTEEKEAAKQLVTRAKNNANQAITDAETAVDVENKKQAGINNIGKITADTGIKTAVKTDLQNQANDKKQEIANHNGSTEEEKQAANTKVDNALQQGLTAVSNAQSIVDVNNAVKSTDQAIQSVQPETAIKDNAKQAIQNSINQQKDAVNQNPEATNEEKQLASNKLDDIANQVTRNIDQANTSNDVEQAKTEGSTQINQFVPSIVKKSNATQELDNAADLKQEELDKTPNASQEDIAEAKRAVQKALTTAKEQVTQSQTDQDVDNAKANGVSEIKAIQPIGTLRQAALEEFTDVYNDKISEIEDDIDGTQEEINAAIKDLENIKTQAEASINQAINVSRLTAAKEHAIENVNSFDTAFTKKSTALAQIKEIANAKENEINENKNATSQEKASAINNIKEQLEIAEININNAETNQEVDNAVTNGETAINQISPEIVTKPNAIGSIGHLANQQVDNIVQSANTEIASATSDIDIAQIKANAMNELNAVVVNVEQKSKAANALKDEADKVQDAIDSNDDATETEKLEAEEQLNDILEQGLSDIEAKNTNDDIAKVKETALEQLKAIKVNTVIKPEARGTIADFIRKQIKLINATPKATKEEKEAAIKQLNSIEKDAVALIKASPSDDEINEIVKDAEQKIAKVEASAKIKDATIKQIKDHILKQKEKINNTGASREQIDKALSQLDRLSSLISDKLEAADTNEAVMKVKEEAFKQIEAILPEIEQQSPNNVAKDPVPDKDEKRNNKGNDDRNGSGEVTDVGSEEKIETGSDVDKQDSSETLPETGQHDYQLPLAGVTLAAGAALVSRRMVQKTDKLK